MTAPARGRGRELLSVLEPTEPVLILPHDHPDPDSLASAEGLRALIRCELGTRAAIARRGIIGRSENRAMVIVLQIPLVLAREVLPGFRGALVLVDTQPGRGNNALPQELRPRAVIDHHPDWGDNAGVPFMDLREGYGATATIVTEYLRELEVPIEPRLATALFYGISSETRYLAREARAADIAASEFLYPLVDKALLGAIEVPRLSRSYYRLVADAVCGSIVCDGVLLALLGEVPYPDATAEVADFLVRLEEASWAVCLARYRGFIYVSLRSNDPNAEAGRLLASLLPPGNAGGHGMTAGGRVALEEDWTLEACALAKRVLRGLGKVGPGARWLLPDSWMRIPDADASVRLMNELPLGLDQEPAKTKRSTP